MAKSMIVNSFDGGKSLTTYVPAGATEAQAFADAVMDSATTVFEETSIAGSDLVDTSRYVNVMIQQTDSGAKAYLNFTIPTSKHEGDVISALQDKTINGVKADKIIIVGMRSAVH